MKFSSFTVLVLAGLVVLSFAPTAGAQQNLVVNGGFEDGLTGWTASGSYQGITGTTVHSGSYAYEAGPWPTPADLFQDIGTQPGTTYNVSFWLKSAGSPSTAVVTFAGTQLLDLSSGGPFTSSPGPWTNYTYSVQATTTSSTLDFQLASSPDHWYLDDVSVTPSAVPEAGTLFDVLGGLALGGMGLLTRHKRRAVNAPVMECGGTQDKETSPLHR
jgi:hypothetical protein